MNDHVPTPQENQKPIVYLKNDPMLPIGGNPNWENSKVESEEDTESLRNVADSFVLLKSLRQSRERLLFHTFPKFSSTNRGRGNKAMDTTVPPKQHSMQSRGKCDIKIGPHTFPETDIFEVHYLAPLPPATVVAPSYWQPTAPYSFVYPSTPSAASSASILGNVRPSMAPTAEMVPAPLISELAATSSVPQELINQVNIAASTDPIFSNLLQLAASKKATQDQLKTLGLLIQSLANMAPALTLTNSDALATQPSNVASSSSGSGYYMSASQPQLPVQEFDLILGFREAPTERWLIPRGCHPVANRSGQDIELRLATTNTGQTPALQSDGNNESQVQHEVPLSLCLQNAPYTLWDTITRWIGGEDKMKLNAQYLDSLVVPKRLYLGLRLRPGSLLSQLQTSCASPYTMKPLKQGPTQVRPSRQRSTATQKRTSEGKTVNSSRSKASHKPAIPNPIRCISCGQPDVPLIMGGRFCRPCVESGKATSAVPTPLPVNPTVTTSITTFAVPTPLPMDHAVNPPVTSTL